MQKYKVTNQMFFADAVKKIMESERDRPSAVYVINSVRVSENQQKELLFPSKSGILIQWQKNMV